MSTQLPEDLNQLPRDRKIELCKTLLDEFGARNVTLQGDELIHSCCLPFGLHRHGDANPSASINVDKLLYSCFVCGGGTLLWWIATCRDTTAHDARSWLDHASGRDGTNLNALLRYIDAIYNPTKDLPSEVIPAYSEKILEPWAFIHPYMTEVRKIPLETLLHFKVGWDPERDRIVIPHFWEGKLVGWSSRRLANDGTPKYRHSPQFPKKTTIFNYGARRPAVVVESPLSVLARFADCPVIEATFGAVVTQGQLRLLSRHPHVVLFFDNDEAGWKATLDVGEHLMAHTEVRVVQNPWSADAADLTKDDFGQLMADAVPFGIWSPPFELEPYRKDNDASSDAGACSGGSQPDP